MEEQKVFRAVVGGWKVERASSVQDNSNEHVPNIDGDGDDDDDDADDCTWTIRAGAG